jgi:hypothetical protein
MRMVTSLNLEYGLLVGDWPSESHNLTYAPDHAHDDFCVAGPRAGAFVSASFRLVEAA